MDGRGQDATLEIQELLNNMGCTLQKIDLRKELKRLYRPSAKEDTILGLPLDS